MIVSAKSTSIKFAKEEGSWTEKLQHCELELVLSALFINQKKNLSVFHYFLQGVDDWVLMRHHLKTIKDVVTDWSFTIASESQYRAPITLEKIFQAAL